MTTSQKALARTTPRRSALTLAKAQVSQHLSHRLPYYITPDEAHELIDAAKSDRDADHSPGKAALDGIGGLEPARGVTLGSRRLIPDSPGCRNPFVNPYTAGHDAVEA